MNYPRNSFHKAIEALQVDPRRHLAPSIYEHAIANLINGQKFVVPDAGKMTENSRFEKIGDALHLPFDRVALLREIQLDGRTLQQLCIAVAAELVTGMADAEGPEFFVSDCLRHYERDAWIPSRPVGVRYDDTISGVQTYEIDGAAAEEEKLFGFVDGHEHGFGALNGLSELLMMLSLSNVSTQRVAGPATLNHKRAKSGKLPIYDYHVLTVDGCVVCATDGNGKTDGEIRSHFRRGHVRRLDTIRRVWVRAAYVHGKADGFVDKDYRVV